jgi:hypothetical protein
VKTVISKRRKSASLDRDQRTALSAWLARRVEPRVDLRRLQDGDVVWLDELRRSGADPRRLDGKEQRRLEQVVEHGADLPPGHFGRLREQDQQRREFARLAAEARRPPRRPALLPAGTVVLEADLGEQLRGGLIWLSHVQALAGLAFQFETATAWGPSSRFEGSHEGGDLTLVVDSMYGPFGRAAGEDETLGNWKVLVEELAERGFFEVERRGREWKIRRGPRLLAAGRAS